MEHTYAQMTYYKAEPQAGYQMAHLMKMRTPENVSRSSRQLLIHSGEDGTQTTFQA